MELTSSRYGMSRGAVTILKLSCKRFWKTKQSTRFALSTTTPPTVSAIGLREHLGASTTLGFALNSASYRLQRFKCRLYLGSY